MSRCPYPAQSVAGPGRRPDGSLAGLFEMGLDGENTWSCQAKVTEASARMFGGQLAGQSLAAAARTTPAGMSPIATHGVFLRPGDASMPVGYRVELIRDGRAYSTRAVRAVQGDRELALFTTQWHQTEQGPGHEDNEGLPLRPPGPQALPYPAPGVLTDALDLRWVDVPDGRGMWFRPRMPLPADPVLHACVACYVSDLWLADTLLRRHGFRYDDSGVRASSLDYSAWFHQPVCLDGWMYLGSSAPVAAGGRGHVQAVLRTPAGDRVATIHQEVSIRPRLASRRGPDAAPPAASRSTP